jgi:hypothetical protein
MVPGLVWSYEIDISKKIVRHVTNSMRADTKCRGCELLQPDLFASARLPHFCRYFFHHFDLKVALYD